MRGEKKVIWYEGMMLNPHHFQQWDRFHNSLLNFRMRSIKPYYWGLTEISIEQESLANDQLKTLSMSGIMPDGFVFNLPATDTLPTARIISEQFQATQQSLFVYLTIPLEKEADRNCQLDNIKGSKDTRFTFEQISIRDDNTGIDEREIGVAKGNFQIKFDGEQLEDYSYLKIAEIVRTHEGEFSLSTDFIPPVLYMKASSNLTGVVRRILELLVARSNALQNRRRYLSSGKLDISLNDLPLYWHLASINRYIPIIKQMFSSGNFHPFDIYGLLISLAGELSSFSPDANIKPEEFPIYDHNNLANCFLIMEKKIRQLLGDVVPSKNYFNIELKKKGETISIAQITEPQLLKEANFYLVCTGDIPENVIANELPLKVRVASEDMINEVLSTATRALPVSYFAQSPAGVPPKAGSQYFRLEKKGPFWEAIEKSQTMVFYIPAEFKGLKTELLAVKVT